MKFVISISIVFFVSSFFSQTSSAALKKEQKKIENKISNTKTLLNTVKNNANISLNELRIVDNQIKNREALVAVYDNQVQAAEIKMLEKSNEINTLKKKSIKLKSQYRAMLLYAYKHRNNSDKIMYILSASSYHEAFKRNKYIKKIASAQKRQVAIIKQHRQLISQEIKNVAIEKSQKLVSLEQKKQEKANIELDKNLLATNLNKLKNEEQKLNSQLLTEEQKKQDLKLKITNAIRVEISIAENKRKKKAAQEAKEKAAKKEKIVVKEKPNNDIKPTKVKTPTNVIVPEKVTPKPKVEKEVVFVESDENIALGTSFATNKGKLPWPVSSGSITEKYGRNAHPTLSGVFTNNNGIDISCPIGQSVRAIFEGEVTSVFTITGAGKVVIVTHGNYKTVYSNLQSTDVKIGSKVQTKQKIGTLLSEGNISICHFEIQLVANGAIQSLNPSLWISK
jgi:septal ring factor EnvC (AmiA/AmiB activator)